MKNKYIYILCGILAMEAIMFSTVFAQTKQFESITVSRADEIVKSGYNLELEDSSSEESIVEDENYVYPATEGPFHYLLMMPLKRPSWKMPDNVTSLTI